MDSPCSLFLVSILTGLWPGPEAPGTIAAMPLSTWPYVSAAIVIWLVTTALTWLVSARVTGAVMREQARQLKGSMKDLLADVRALTSDVHGLRDGLHAAEEGRTQCELRAVKTFTTREELTRVLIQVTAGTENLANRMDDLGKSFRDSVGKVHGRVDDLQDRVGGLEGRTNIAPRVPAELGEQSHG